jgi:hypothetical protein
MVVAVDIGGVEGEDPNKGLRPSSSLDIVSLMWAKHSILEL